LKISGVEEKKKKKNMFYNLKKKIIYLLALLLITPLPLLFKDKLKSFYRSLIIIIIEKLLKLVLPYYFKSLKMEKN
jgi:hypothetical protein